MSCWLVALAALLYATQQAWPASNLFLHAGGAGRSIAASGRTAEFRLTAAPVPINGEEFRLIIGGRTYTSRDFTLVSIKENDGNLSVQFKNADVELIVEHLRKQESLQKLLRIRALRDLVLERVDVESLGLPPGIAVQIARSTPLTKEIGGLPICIFLETGQSGAFLSLDFAYSEIAHRGSTLDIGYQPFRKLKAGDVYTSHSVTLSAYRLAGKKSGLYDDAAAAAFRRYIRFGYAPPHFNRPQLYYTSIMNRYTEVDRSVPPTPRGQRPFMNTIFYSLTGSNYYMLRPERMPDEIDFCKSLSMEICQVYEGPFEWTDGNPTAQVLRQVGEHARDRGVKLGLYTASNHLATAHFQYYGEEKGDPAWKILHADGKRDRGNCWGSNAFTNWFTDTLIETSIRGNFQNANFDFLKIVPCFDPRHDHASGDKGLYHQVFNLVRSLNTVRAAVPGYIYDSNLGWGPFVPKIAPSMDGFYLTDPHFTVYTPALNTTEHLDNSRRYQMVSYFLKNLTPVEYFRNCEYFLVQDSIIPDVKTFEYGILQGLAFTPNLQLGEARLLFEGLSADAQERARRFLRRWTQFVTDNFEFYANTLIPSGLPRIGQLEVYAHAKGNRSFVFLVNPNPFPRETSIRLDSSVGLSGSGPYLARELYPENRLISGGTGLYFNTSEVLNANVSSRTVLVLEIASPPDFTKEPIRIAGAPASYERFSKHYRIEVEANQGAVRPIQIYPPEGERITRAEANGEPLQLETIRGGYGVQVRFPKEPVQEHILEWYPVLAPLEKGIESKLWSHNPSGPATVFPVLDSTAPGSNFLGARVENLLNERFVRELNVYFEYGNPLPASKAAPMEEATQESPKLSGAGRDWWYMTRFPVAWVQRYFPPPSGDHNYISLNFQRPGEVEIVKAWLNGKEVNVEKFHHWSGPEWANNYYIDGTRMGIKRGENSLAVFVRYTAAGQK